MYIKSANFNLKKAKKIRYAGSSTLRLSKEEIILNSARRHNSAKHIFNLYTNY